MSIEKNGGTAMFANVGAKEVYVAIAYDEGGGFSGSGAAASRVAGDVLRRQERRPIPQPPVTPGAKGKVSVTLTDAQRFK